MDEDRDDLVIGYGRALVAVAEAEGALERIADELFTVARSIDGSRELADQLTNPGVGVSQKLDLVERLLGGRVHQATLGAVLLVVQGGHVRRLSDIAEEVARVAAAARNRVHAEVRSAVDLDEGQRTRLAAALGRATGKDVDLKVTVDPSVVGGVVATVGDTVIDGTVSRRLADLKTRLTG